MIILSSLTSNNSPKLSFLLGGICSSITFLEVVIFSSIIILFFFVPVINVLPHAQIHPFYLLYESGSGPFKYFSLPAGIDILSIGVIVEIPEKQKERVPGSLCSQSKFLEPSTCSFYSSWLLRGTHMQLA